MNESFFNGERVGRYELVTRLSIGGMAELFLARLEGPGGFQKLVALKMILPDVASDDDFVKMFLDEARLSAELSHPNLGQVFDLGRQQSGELYLAMEFLSGQNLGAVMRAARVHSGRLPLEVTARVIRDVCLGLHAAHSHVDPSGAPRPVIHRDVAPKNVMVTFEGHVKVIDFGIAHAAGRQSRTQTGVVKGTPSYMAPEQMAGAPPTPATDVYAVGIMLHECLTGERLFTAGTELARFSTPGGPRAKNAEVSAALDAVCLKALAVEPEHRFQSARELARALTEAVPTLADEEALGNLMATLFPGQRATIAKLAETARDPARPSSQISVLARNLFHADATPAVPEEAPVTTRIVERATRTADDELPFLSSPDAGTRRVLIGGIVASLVLFGALGAVFGSEAEPVGAVVDGPVPVRGLSAPPPAPPPEAPPTNEALMAGARSALARTDVDTAEALLRQCKAGAGLCPEALALVPLLPIARKHAVLLEGAKFSLSMGDLDKAAELLAEVGEGTLLHERYVELETERARRAVIPTEASRSASPIRNDPRRAQLIKEATAAKKEGRYKAAISLLMECLARAPNDADCTVSLASVYATRGTKENNEEDNRKAKSFYESFLRVADPSDPRIERVRQILRGSF